MKVSTLFGSVEAGKSMARVLFAGLSITLLVFGFTGVSGAGVINPISYTSSTSLYHPYYLPDTGGVELTDGIYGENNWTPGVPNDPWVGWALSTATINFQFDNGFEIDSIKVFSVHTGNTVLSEISIYTSSDGNDWNPVLSFDPLPTSSGLYTYEFDSLSILDPYIRLELPARGNWTLISEVDFEGELSNPVPVPGSILLLSSGILGFVGIMRNRIR